MKIMDAVRVIIEPACIIWNIACIVESDDTEFELWIGIKIVGVSKFRDWCHTCTSRQMLKLVVNVHIVNEKIKFDLISIIQIAIDTFSFF